MTTTHRWGIAATGGIAAQFATDLALLPGAELVAVASRTAERAEEFGAQFGARNRHASYDALADDADVDIVYIASPQTAHCADAIRFLEAGKHVLCEKPFAINVGQTDAMIAAAERAGVFLMEALWSRFLPPYVRLREVLDEGRIGTPRIVDSDFGFYLAPDASHRLFDPALGGGGLLDLGIYPLQLATFVLGEPVAAQAVGDLGPTGVDDTVIATVTHKGGTRSVSKTSISLNLACQARITGDAGHIALPKPMHHPAYFDVVVGEQSERIETPWEGNGLRFQAGEVQARIEAGDTQSPVMPWSETRRLTLLLDELRAQIGLRFDADSEHA